MSCFVYGTLMYPEVLTALIQRVPRMEPAIIHGYQRYRIRGQVFPGTIRSAAPGAQVQGLVLFDLLPDELEMLDEFEGEEYFKEGVEARLVQSGGAVPTLAYLWQDRLRPLLYGEWDPEQFREQQLGSYVEMCSSFAADVQAQRGWKGQFPTSSDDEGEGEGEDGQAAAAAGSTGACSGDDPAAEQPAQRP
ncbi:hypothetical protein ABPG75_012902 [Micractinium tetrahymenae]